MNDQVCDTFRSIVFDLQKTHIEISPDLLTRTDDDNLAAISVMTKLTFKSDE